MVNKLVLLFIPDSKQREAIAYGLKRVQGLTLRPVSTAKQAFEELTESHFDVIICDTELGHLDGWRFSRLIRSGALTANKNIPIIVMSSTYSERIAEATARAFQINYFIAYDKRELLPATLGDIFDENSPTEPPKPSLLVVEDYEDTVRLISRVLGNRFEIEVATDGRTGLNKWLEKRHSLVLLDLMLPEMSGDEVLREIIKISPDQSVVMMTARSNPETAGKLIIEGAVDFISKPFQAEQLRKVCEIADQRENFIISNQEFSMHQEALFHEKELAQVTLNSIADGVITTGLDGIIEYMNPAAERLSGWQLEEAVNKHVYQVLHCVDDTVDSTTEYDPASECLLAQCPVHGSRTLAFINRDGNPLTLDHVTSPIRNRENVIIGTVMVFRDITEAHVLEKKLEYQAKHDVLTGLTNRAAFEEQLRSVLEQQKHQTVNYTLCYIDLDQFKVVNDTCGHNAGDLLLKQIKAIMLGKIRKEKDLLARFGGDEFVLLLQDCPAQQATRISQEICEAIQSHPFVYENKSFTVGASIGVVPITYDMHDVNDVLRMADSACYIAKEKGRNRVHVYHVNDHELIKRRGEMHVISKINNAIENSGFGLFFQEIRPLSHDGDGKYLEILIRMKNEEGEWISPGFFLPAAERYSASPKIDRWVVESTLTWFYEHPQVLEKLERCSINLSGLTFCDHSFIDFVAKKMTELMLPTTKFCFEITETSAIHNLHDASEFITHIKRLGCSFALDDFGSGMSSYAYLKNLPIDYLKIDGMFVKGILEDPFDFAMVKSINDIGHVFGLKTIAEYVESPEIMTELKKLGVDFVQGYAVNKPTHISALIPTVTQSKLA